MDLLSPHKVKTILDVGCGNGNFLLHLQKQYEAEGIDLSPRMVEVATQKGVTAYNRQISSVKESFDAIVAVGDVLNYLRRDELKSFLIEVERILNCGGIFICDVNTLIGFEEVTAGSMSVDFVNQFLSINAEYLEGVLTTEITLFEQLGGDCFKKEQDTIFQFYHDRARIEESTSLELLEVKDLGMFCDEDDKTIFIFQKS